MKTVLGIDEAGRGPIIGPLVIAGALFYEEDNNTLKQLGIKDSKLITPKKRKILFEKIKKIAKSYEIILVEPLEIDQTLEGDSSNLNWLEADKIIQIINLLNPDQAIIDCPSNNIAKYKDYIHSRLNNKNTKLIVEHKADLNYVESGAASILAKVTRDKEIEEVKKEIGIDFGSGYPSDPKTKEFIQKYWDKHSIIMRKSWQTYQNVLKKNRQKNLKDF